MEDTRWYGQDQEWDMMPSDLEVQERDSSPHSPRHSPEVLIEEHSMTENQEDLVRRLVEVQEGQRLVG